MSRVGIAFWKLTPQAQAALDHLVFGLMRERRRKYRHVRGELGRESDEFEAERRGHWRVRTPDDRKDIEAVFKAPPARTADGPPMDEEVRLAVWDLSTTGCGLENPNELPFWHGMLVRFSIAAGGQEVEVHGTVVYPERVERKVTDTR